MNDGQFVINTYPSIVDQLKSFVGAYQYSLPIIPPDEPRRKFTSVDERVCRFCKKDASLTTFKNDSHIIPQLLGNKYLVSDFECDICNSFFSAYESNLTEYLGAYRTVFNIPGRKNKVPKYKSSNNGLIAAPNSELNIPKAITIEDRSGTGFEINDKTGDTTISYTKNGYVPLLAYKALLKIALTLIDETEIDLYNETFDFLMSDIHDDKYAKIAQVHLFYGSYRSRSHCYLFKKSNSTARLPTHIFQLYFENIVFQIFIPFCSLDSEIYDGKTVTALMCPPIFYTRVEDSEQNYTELRDWSSKEKVWEKGQFKMTMDAEALKNASAVNPLTGQEIVDYLFDPDKIVKMVIVPAGSILQLKNNDKNE